MYGKKASKVAVIIFLMFLCAIFFIGIFSFNNDGRYNQSSKVAKYNIDCANTISVVAKKNYDGKVFRNISYEKTNNIVNSKVGNSTLNIDTLELKNNLDVNKIEQTAKKKRKKVKYYSTGSASLNKACDKVLNKIIKPSMSQKQKANAIYNWVSTKIRYSGSSSKDAKRILRVRKGNCFAFCYASKALLTRVGISNKVVKGNSGHHYWNMVKVNGSWYHFDATPGWGKKRFLWTNKQMKKYKYKKLRYSYNASKYPKTP